MQIVQKRLFKALKLLGIASFLSIFVVILHETDIWPVRSLTTVDWLHADLACAPHGGLYEALAGTNSLQARCVSGTVVDLPKRALPPSQPTRRTTWRV